jgi:hypothetical protein
VFFLIAEGVSIVALRSFIGRRRYEHWSGEATRSTGGKRGKKDNQDPSISFEDRRGGEGVGPGLSRYPGKRATAK